MLSENNFLLPDLEQPFLPGTKNKTPQFYLGLPGWNFKEQERTRASPEPKPGTLPFYANHFTTTELNATYNTLPSQDEVGKWYRAVKDKNFIFCPQVPAAIADIGKIGLPKIGLTTQFLERMKGLQEKLGNAFIHVSHTYTWEDKEGLLAYFNALPREIELSVELSNAEWLSNPDKMLAFATALNRVNKGIVITDSPVNRELLQLQLSTPVAFIRFYCQPDLEIDMFRIEQWKKQLKSWYWQGLEKCYFFLHVEDKKVEEELAEYVKHELTF